MANEYDRTQAKKRGGGRQRISLDLAAGESRLDLTPVDHLTPERAFEKNWALTLLEVVVGRLQAEFEAGGKGRQFELLRDSLTGDRESDDFLKMLLPQLKKDAANFPPKPSSWMCVLSLIRNRSRKEN
nr:hypothetical protein [Rhodopirellula sp. SM50]